jgi:hypothetical protein
MKKVTKKTQWVNAINQTINNYKEQLLTHNVTIYNCVFCELATNCGNCIMGVDYSCLKHHTLSTRMLAVKMLPHETQTRIIFWEQVLLLIEPMTPRQFAGKFKYFPKILSELDKQVYTWHDLLSYKEEAENYTYR